MTQIVYDVHGYISDDLSYQRHLRSIEIPNS